MNSVKSHTKSLLMKKSSIVIIACLLVGSLSGQDLNSHYLYQLNWLNINAAYTGKTEGTQVLFNPGTQWTGISNNPSNAMLAVHGKLNESQGLGGKVILDQNGIFNTLTLEMLYSYQIKINDEQGLNFGASAGMFNTSIDNGASFNDFTDGSDPTLGSGFYNETQFLASFGFLYQFKELEIGLSLPHMIVSGRDISDHLFGTAKYDFFIADGNLRLTPMLVYQNLTNSTNIMDIGGQVGWSDLVWIQATYRTNETMGLGLGFSFKGMDVGYMYNMFNGPASEIANNSQQIYIAFTFKKQKAENKTVNPTKDYSQLNAVLNDLKEISSEGNKAVMQEVSEIQTELAALIKKLEEGSYTSEDDAKLNSLEKRVEELKMQ